MGDMNQSRLVADLVLYLHHFPLEPTEKLILEGIVTLRVRGRMVQPRWVEMATWIQRTTRTVARALAVLEDDGLIQRRRRGKRLSNLYFIGRRLWRYLMRGRRWKREKEDKHAEVPLTPERAKELFNGLLAGLPRGLG